MDRLFLQQLCRLLLQPGGKKAVDAVQHVGQTADEAFGRNQPFKTRLPEGVDFFRGNRKNRKIGMFRDKTADLPFSLVFAH